MSLLPQQILPETTPIGTVDPTGKVAIDHNWWLLLYNLCQEVLGVGGSPPANILPLLDTALPIDAISAQAIGQQLYPITAAEIAASVTPTNYGYAPGLVDRYGVNVSPGSTDMTGAIQASINQHLKGGAAVQLGAAKYAVATSLTVTLAGTRLTNGFRLYGVAPNVSQIIQTGTPSAVLTIQGTTPNSVQTDGLFILERFSIVGNNSGSTNGIELHSVADFRISNVISRGFNYALYGLSCLLGQIDQQCEFSDSNYGGYFTYVNSSLSANVITFANCRFEINSTWGLFIDGGSDYRIVSCDFEVNGTALNYSTGGLHVGANINALLGASIISLDGCWFEANNGQTIQVDSPASGQSLISFSNTSTLSEDAGHAITVGGAFLLEFDNCMSPTANATWNLTAQSATLTNCFPAVLTDTGVTYPTYNEVYTATTAHKNGRLDTSQTLTLTGVTATVTGTPNVYQQGNEILVDFVSPITGTSNSAACTLTGLAAKYAPATNGVGNILPIYDNGQVTPLYAEVASGTPTITVGAGHSFTTSGQKGLGQCSLRWRIS